GAPRDHERERAREHGKPGGSLTHMATSYFHRGSYRGKFANHPTVGPPARNRDRFARGRRSDASGAQAATFANSSIVRVSPRRAGSTPAAVRTVSAPAGEPAQRARAERRVLRRWENAASMTANTCSRLAFVSGCSRRTRRTSAESTRGTGQKMPRPIVPARAALAYQATFADGTPYTRDPGSATIRSATSAWTMTRAVS